MTTDVQRNDKAIATPSSVLLAVVRCGWVFSTPTLAGLTAVVSGAAHCFPEAEPWFWDRCQNALPTNPGFKSCCRETRQLGCSFGIGPAWIPGLHA